MGYIDTSENMMRPRKGYGYVDLPVTFDYSGGRKDTFKGKIIWVGALAVVSLIVGIGIMTSKDGNVVMNIAFGLLFMYIMSLVIRFPVLGEHNIRNNMVNVIKSDYKKSFKDFWGIYSIDDEYPYYCHLRNGKSALYILFEKDVILGKEDDSEYEHYEAIADAYNMAGSEGIGMFYIDYMDNIGNDDRLNESFKSLSDIENPDMKEIMTDIFTHLKDMMVDTVSTFDVYVYTFKCSEQSFMYSLQKILACMMEANYISFKILNEDDLRELPKAILNLKDFSIVDATVQAFSSSRKVGIVPINIIKPNGDIEKLNKTQDEVREERRKKEEEKNKKGSKSNIEDEELNLFDD